MQIISPVQRLCALPINAVLPSEINYILKYINDFFIINYCKKKCILNCNNSS